MPHIVDPSRFKTKRSFREAVAADPQAVYLEDPSIFPGACSGSVREVVAQKGLVTVTNHPKRSWFAQLTRAADGSSVVR